METAHLKVIGGAMFLAAAILGSIGSMIAVPAAAVLAVPMATVARFGNIAEIFGSIAAGLIASFLTRKRG